MSTEDRARIARENGAKSKGPKSEEGKAKSARNGIKTGEFAEKLACFVPPDAALLCNEDRQNFYKMMDGMIETYQPINTEALNIVRQMAIARWQIERCNTCITIHWNLALVEGGTHPLTVRPELADIQIMARASVSVNTGAAVVEKLNRQIDRLEMRINRLRRSLRDVHTHFPAVTEEKRTQPEPEAVEETKGVTLEKEQKAEKPIYLTERDPIVLAAYRREFPNRKLILLPPDDVAKGIEIEDDMPRAPRRAA